MQLRRKIALLSSALVITAPALTACGFNWATDRENDTIAGTNNRTGSIDVLNAVLVAAENGTARLVVTFSNNNQEKPAEVTGVRAGEGSDVTISGFKPVKMDAYAMATPQKDDAEVLVKGDQVERGGHVRLEFDFSDGTSSMVNVQVMPAWEEYAGWGPGGASEERTTPVGPHGDEHAESQAPDEHATDESSADAEGEETTGDASAEPTASASADAH